MTPDEHYREAERLLSTLHDYTSRGPLEFSTSVEQGINRTLALAQVHATLATLSPERPYL